MATEDQPPQSLVAADIFFGLGAIILIVLALLSLNFQTILSTAAQSDAATRAELRSSATRLSQTQGVVLLADAQGIQISQDAQSSAIALDAISGLQELTDHLRAGALLIIGPEGREAAFLLQASAARAGIPSHRVVRLPIRCRDFVPSTADTIECAR